MGPWLVGEPQRGAQAHLQEDGSQRPPPKEGSQSFATDGKVSASTAGRLWDPRMSKDHGCDLVFWQLPELQALRKGTESLRLWVFKGALVRVLQYQRAFSELSLRQGSITRASF